MAESGVDWTLEGLSNPMLVQEQLLDRFEKETGGVVVDTNNPASELMEAFASTSSKIIRKIEDEVRPAIYAACTNNASDLYKHLSDYDYIDVFASPATSTLQMIVDRVYVYNNSLPVAGTNYRKMVIPASTRFTVGEHVFGIYYPIEIRSNESTGRFSVVYDTTTPNPLHTLSNNSLEYDIRRYSGHDLVFIKIPVYQFNMTVVEESLISGSGYRRAIAYEDKFYAIRCTAEVLQNRGHDDTVEDEFETKELSLCVSGQVYDPDTVTAVFTPDLENNECIVEIPYTYFSNGLIRGTLHIELYTTKGAMNYSIPTDTEEVCTIDMFSQITSEEVATYADPFKRMPALQVIPLSTNIIGGSDGMTFDTLKKRVVTGTIKSKTLQTPDDIDAYFSNHGYVTTLLRDGITDRVFLCHSTVRNTSSEVIGADAIGTLFDFRAEQLKDYDTIITSGANTFTVLPSTMYKLNTSTGVCYPLTLLDRITLDNLVPTEKIAMFNENIYTVSPYHLKVDTSTKYPTTVTYDMTDVAITSREFIGDRVEPNCQLILNASAMEIVKGPIKDDYRLTFRVSRSGLDDVGAVVSDGDAVGRKNFRCIVGLKNDDGTFYFGEATWDSWTGEYDIFHIDITSNYKFHTANGNHTVMMTIGNNEETDVFLTAEVRVMLLINGDINSVAKLVGKDNHCLVTDFTGVSASILDSTKDYYALSEHKIMCKFGSVINELDQRINLAYSEQGYLKYDTTKFKTLEVPIYKTNTDGTLVIEDGEYKFTLTEDEIYDTSKVYYALSSGKYIQQPAPSDPSTINPKAKGWYTLTHDMKVTELYPKGTLTCVTKDEEAIMKFNHYTVDNYLGRTATYIDALKVKNTIEVTDATPTLYPDTEFTLEKSPIVPRYQVTNASKVPSGDDSYAIGKYELFQAKDQPGLSSSGNVWYKVGTSVDSNPAYIDRVYSEDALHYVFDSIICNSEWGYALSTDTTYNTNKSYYTRSGSGIPTDPYIYTKVDVPASPSSVDPSALGYYEFKFEANIAYTFKMADGVYDPKPLMKASAGTFILVENDGTDFDNEVPIISTVNANQRSNPEMSPRAVLYYCVDVTMTEGSITESTWLPVAQGGSMYSMACNVFFNTQSPRQRQNYGFVYRNIAHGIVDVGTASTIAIQQFLTWLNTKTVNGYEIPNFEKFDQDKWSEFKQCDEDHPEVGKTYFMCTYYVDPSTGAYTLYDPTGADPAIEILKKVGSSKRPLKPTDDLAEYYAAAKEYNAIQESAGTDYRRYVCSTYIEVYGYGWTTMVNKWPWDVKKWNVVTDTGIAAIGTPTPSRTELVNIAEDPDYTTAFDSGRLVPYCEYTSGQYRLVNGELQEDPDHPRVVQYLIEMLQLDAKLGQTTANKATNAFPNNVTSILRTHFQMLGECRQNMFTNTRLLFYPSRSLGLAKFELGDSATSEIRMDVSVGFKLYVSAATAEDTTLVNNIHTKIVNIIDTKIEETGALNCSEVAAEIMSQLSDSVFRVDILGINGDVNLQTIKCVDKEAKVHLGHQLTLLSDELTIDIDRALNLEITVVED